MKEKLCIVLRYILGIPLFCAGIFVLTGTGPVEGCIVFGFLALLEAVLIYIESGRFLDLRLLFTLSWLLGISLSCLGLSRRQSEWSDVMWIITGGFYFCMMAGYDLTYAFMGKREQVRLASGQSLSRLEDRELLTDRIRQCIFIVSGLGLSGFLLETIVFQADFPLFADYSHAYTSFHISGVHYFVVSLLFVPTLSMIYILRRKTSIRENLLLLLLNGLALLVQVLLLSKLQLLMSVAMPVLVWLMLQEKVSKRKIFWISLIVSSAVIAVFVYMIINREYPDGYLQKVFKFKKRYKTLPVAVQYVYMYIVNNYENLNLLTMNLQQFSYGKRCFYPLAALSGLKLFQVVKDFFHTEVYRTCEELTTLTILYDVYGDYGIPGVLVFGLILGGVSAFITRHTIERKTFFGILLTLQLTIYLGLSFFATWFSDPTVWFWFAYTGLMALWCTKDRGRFHFSLRYFMGEL